MVKSKSRELECFQLNIFDGSIARPRNQNVTADLFSDEID